MEDQDEFSRNSYLNKDPSRGDTPEAVELAYWLQYSAPNDPTVLERLVFRYAEELYRWVEILVYYQKNYKPSRAEIFVLLKFVFKRAIKHVEQFHGNESVINWLFGIAYHVVREWVSKTNPSSVRYDSNQWQNPEDQSQNPQSIDPDDLSHLSEKIRSTLILRYLFELDLPEIAGIVDTNENDIHHRIIKGRNRLIDKPVRSHMNGKIQAFVDGMPEDNPKELEKFNQHLRNCNVCQTALLQIETVEKKITEKIKERWKIPTLSSDQLNILIQSVIDENMKPEAGRSISLHVRQLAWVLGLAILLGGFAIVSIKLIPIDQEIAQPELTPSQQLPPVAKIQQPEESPESLNDLTAAPLYIAPAFSSDGVWAVFSAVTFNPTSLLSIFQTIEIYNRETNTIQVISESSAYQESWVLRDLAPSISGDGRWIVYVSTSYEPQLSGNACLTANQIPCLDIFLYDRITGSTKRVTQAANGGAADGYSLAPTISQDGEWVAFWSTASNLIDGFNLSCEKDGTSVECWRIYLYNILSGEISWIPIRTIPGDSVYGVDRISLSADARFIGFTVSSTAQAEGFLPGNALTTHVVADGNEYSIEYIFIPPIVYGNEAIIFDQVGGKYELENQTQDGLPGNGPSSSPVISADGKYVAFISAATNLVADDNNNHSDIFVRDRESGKIELINMSPLHAQGTGERGLIFSSRDYYSLNISDDGRYVVFESAASNLGNNGNDDCNQNEIQECHFLYVHDRQTGNSNIISALTNQDFTLFPTISSDGRWISYMQYFHNCRQTQPECSNVMLYDRKSNWLTNLTSYDEGIPEPRWKYSGGISLPRVNWSSSAFALSPDGAFVALGGNDSKIRIWNSSDVSVSNPNVEPIKILEIDGNDSFSSLQFSPNGRWLAGGTTHGATYVWNLIDGKILYQTNQQVDLVRKMVFTQNCTQLVISTSNKVWTWSMRDDQMFQMDGFLTGTSDAYAIDILPRGTMIASARSDGTVWLQSLPDGKVIARMGTNLHFASGLAFSRDGSLLAVRLSNGTIDLWRIIQNGNTSISVELINNFRSLSGYTGLLAFTPDNKYLIASIRPGETSLFSIPDGKISDITAPVPNKIVFNLAFSVGGDEFAAVSEDIIMVWGIPEEQPSTYYVHARADHLVDINPNTEMTASGLPIPVSIYDDISGGILELRLASTVLPFQFMIPTRLPDGMSFYAASVNDEGSVWLRYDAFNKDAYRGSLYIYEQRINGANVPILTVGASAEIINSEVETISGTNPTEYVQGDWAVAPSYTQSKEDSVIGAVHDVWTWKNTSDAQRLRWQQNGIFLAIYYQPYAPYSQILDNQGSTSGWTYLSSHLDHEDLLQIASGMMPFSDLNNVNIINR